MGSRFRNLALIHYENAVRSPDSGEPVGNDDDGFAPDKPFEGQVVFFRYPAFGPDRRNEKKGISGKSLPLIPSTFVAAWH